jgi:hypothetical protein
VREQDRGPERRLVQVEERALEWRLFCGLLRVLERLPLRWLLRLPERRLDRRPERVEKR